MKNFLGQTYILKLFEALSVTNNINKIRKKKIDKNFIFLQD